MASAPDVFLRYAADQVHVTETRKDRIREHFEEVAPAYDRWKDKNRHYYDLLLSIYREFVPEGAAVLEVGCGTGTLLAGLSSSRGVGVDISDAMVAIAAARHPSLRFVTGDAERLDLGGETFDFIIIPDVVEHLVDPEAMFRSVRRACHADTRVVVTVANPLWAPVLHLAERLGLKMPEGDHRWLEPEVIVAMATRAGLGLKSHTGRTLMPKEIPVLSRTLNSLARRPAFRRFTLTQVFVFAAAR